MAPPRGANNYLRWRRTIDEHLELGRLTFTEFGMLAWLCTKASPRAGTLRTNWPELALQTGLSPGYVERVCRSLKEKCYVWYPTHAGRWVVEVAIHKFPLPGGRYTDLRDRFEAGAEARLPGAAPEPAGAPPEEHPSEAPVQAPVQARVQVPVQVAAEMRVDSPTSPPGRIGRIGRIRKEEKDSLRVRAADLSTSGSLIAREEAVRRAPAVLRETVEFFAVQTGQTAFEAADLVWLERLDAQHTPAVIRKTIGEAVARFRQRGRDPAALTWAYVGESLRHFTTRKPPIGPTPAGWTAEPAPSRYPPGVTRLW